MGGLQVPYSWKCPLLDTHTAPLLELLSRIGEASSYGKHSFAVS
jgi:hypothetical protein